MPDVVLYCQVHQPYRLRRFRVFDIGNGGHWFDEEANRSILRRVAEKCYLPTNRLLGELIRRSEGRFRIALSLSGVLIEQLEAEIHEALDSFRELVDTGGVEILGETYHHSLSALADGEEFETQVQLHRQVVARVFGRRPRVFRNTELVYADGLGPTIERLGFRGALVEGADQVLGWRSPNFVYAAETAPGLRLLPRNYRLSDDLGFRFSARGWKGWPLTADKYAGWIAGSEGDSVHLFLDYETFGEHQWPETGIFEFLTALPGELERRNVRTRMPSELLERTPVATLSFPRPTSWADAERDVSAWLGNRLQQAAHERLYRLRPDVLATQDEALIRRWRRLTTSDHVYYMSTKDWDDGSVHAYFSPYETPYDAFIAFMNVLQDLEQQIKNVGGEGVEPGRPQPEARAGPAAEAAA